jgi:hypothetical protein
VGRSRPQRDGHHHIQRAIDPLRFTVANLRRPASSCQEADVSVPVLYKNVLP